MDPTTYFWTLVAVTSLFMSLAWVSLIMGGRAFLNKGKTWVCLVDDDGGNATMLRRRVVGHDVTVGNNKNGNKPRTYKLHSRARYQEKKGPLFIVDRTTGWNYKAPSVIDAGKDPKLARLMISDPTLYHDAIKHNDVQDSLSANDEEKTHWIVSVAPWAFFGVLVLLLSILGLLLKVFSGQEDAAVESATVDLPASFAMLRW